MASKHYFYIGYNVVLHISRIPEIVTITAKQFRNDWVQISESVANNGPVIVATKMVNDPYATTTVGTNVFTKRRDAEIALLQEVKQLKSMAESFVLTVEQTTKALVEKERNKSVEGQTVYLTEYDHKKERNVVRELVLTKGILKNSTRLTFDDESGKPDQIYCQGNYWYFDKLSILREEIEELEEEINGVNSRIESIEEDIDDAEREMKALTKQRTQFKGDLTIAKAAFRKAGGKLTNDNEDD